MGTKIKINGNENSEEEVKLAAEVSNEEAEQVVVNSNSTKKVTVRALENHSCIIGGNPIAVKKDSQAQLDADVAAILINSGIVVKL